MELSEGVDESVSERVNEMDWDRLNDCVIEAECVSDDICSTVTVSEAAIDELSVCVCDCVRERCILEDVNDDVSV